jgi:DNA repair protein RadC
MDTSIPVFPWLKVSEIQLIYRSKVKAADRPEVKSPKDAYQLFLQTWDMDKIYLVEQFKVLFLNQSSRALGICDMFTGGITSVHFDVRLIYAAAIKLNATSIIVAHNHPSGLLSPSTADELCTRKLKAAGEHLDIKMLDHLIISADGYYSFADEGLL